VAKAIFYLQTSGGANKTNPTLSRTNHERGLRGESKYGWRSRQYVALVERIWRDYESWRKEVNQREMKMRRVLADQQMSGWGACHGSPITKLVHTTDPCLLSTSDQSLMTQ